MTARTPPRFSREDELDLIIALATITSSLAMLSPLLQDEYARSSLMENLEQLNQATTKILQRSQQGEGPSNG